MYLGMCSLDFLKMKTHRYILGFLIIAVWVGYFLQTSYKRGGSGFNVEKISYRNSVPEAIPIQTSEVLKAPEVKGDPKTWISNEDVVPLVGFPLGEMFYSTICFPENGKQIYIFPHDNNYGVLIFDQNGVLKFQENRLNILEERVAIFNDFILSHGPSSLRLWRVTNEEIFLLNTFNLQPIAETLSSGTNSQPTIQFDDLHFEMEGEMIKCWGFNLKMNELTPENLHVSFLVNVHNKEVKFISSFGKATLMDRIETYSNRQRTVRVNNTFWVPRRNDPQIDIFELNGDLKNTLSISFNFGEVEDLDFPNSIARVVAYKNSKAKKEYLSTLPFIRTILFEEPDIVYVEVFRPETIDPLNQRMLSIYMTNGQQVAGNIPIYNLPILISNNRSLYTLDYESNASREIINVSLKGLNLIMDNEEEL